MIACLCVGAGGFVGSVFRYLLSSIPVDSSFPAMTFIINIIGAFFIGFIMGMVSKAGIKSDNLVLFLKVGVCGGFTTFSTYALELSGLFNEGKWGTGIAYGSLSVILCLAAVYAGNAFSRVVL